MTIISPDTEGKIQMEAFFLVSADVSFASNHFPNYKLGADDQIVEERNEDSRGPTAMEVVEREVTQLSDKHKRLSVRDLASKFEKNLVAATELSDEVNLKEPTSLEGHVLLKKLRDALESLRGHLAGSNKDDVEKAISMVEALAVKLTQKEGELIQEKFEVKRLINILKQASEDAKKLVNQEKSYACAEVESARAVVQRCKEALGEQERHFQFSNKEDVDKVLGEIQEARKMKLLHQPIKVMDMELELRELKFQIHEKSLFSLKLQKELEVSKRVEQNNSSLYILDGSLALGSCLCLRPQTNNAPSLSDCSIQWYRIYGEENRKEFISGANNVCYAPDPLDAGCMLEAEIASDGQKFIVTTAHPIELASGLGSYVEKLSQNSNTGFQMNGQHHPSRSLHAFNVGKTRMKLCRVWMTKARESYSTSMQLCGVRGDCNGAAKALFWQARKGLSFVLTFDSEWDRNAAIMLARKYAFDCNVTLAGPDDHVQKSI